MLILCPARQGPLLHRKGGGGWGISDEHFISLAHALNKLCSLHKPPAIRGSLRIYGRLAQGLYNLLAAQFALMSYDCRPTAIPHQQVCTPGRRHHQTKLIGMRVRWAVAKVSWKRHAELCRKQEQTSHQLAVMRHLFQTRSRIVLQQESV